jgi:ssDNA-specific exonuclease RecJ
VGSPEDALNVTKGIIDLAKDLIVHVIPQYKTAYEALTKVLRELSQIHQILFEKAYTFEVMFLKKPNKDSFLDFYAVFSNFMNSDNYYEVQRLCRRLCKVFKDTIKGFLTRIFHSKNSKFHKTKEMFNALCDKGSVLEKYIYDTLERLESAIDKIRHNYDDHPIVHKEFLASWSKDRQKVRLYIKELNDLGLKYDALI